MANDTAFAQSLMLVNKRLGLLAMTRGARLVQASHRHASGRLADVLAVRVVALNAIHFSFQHRVMLGKIELGVGLQMAGETGCRIAARVDDEFPTSAPCGNMFAAGSVAGFTTAQTLQPRLFK